MKLSTSVVPRLRKVYKMEMHRYKWYPSGLFLPAIVVHMIISLLPKLRTNPVRQIINAATLQSSVADRTKRTLRTRTAPRERGETRISVIT